MKKLLSEIKNTEPKRGHGNLQDLKDSIADVGLINPLTIDQEGNLLAGRRRYQALLELYGQKFEADVHILPVDGDPLEAFRVAIQENLKRKNLTEVEEATVIKEYDELKRKLEGEQLVGKHHSLPNFGNDGWSQAKTAEALGVSQQTISRDIKIATAVEEYPKLAQYTHGQKVLTEYKREKAKEEVLKADSPSQGNNYELYCGDFREICQSLEPNSIDCILTDPPYGEDYLPLYDALAEIALRLLKPGGSLIIISGLMFLPQLLAKVGKHLSYQWVISMTMGTGTSRVWQRKVCQAWKPILWFVKGSYDGDWITDLVRSEKIEKGLDEWQQPEALMTKLVDCFSQPNGTILDPMMGVGTTGIAACSSGRRFIGCEVDKETFLIAKGRLGGRA